MERDAFFKFRINIFCSSLQFCDNASTGRYQTSYTALMKTHIQQTLAVRFILHTRCTGMKRFCRNCVQLLQLTQRGKRRYWLQSSEFCSTRIRYFTLNFKFYFCFSSSSILFKLLIMNEKCLKSDASRYLFLHLKHGFVMPSWKKPHDSGKERVEVCLPHK